MVARHLARLSVCKGKRTLISRPMISLKNPFDCLFVNPR
jgi:hypothetical protein